MSRIDVLGVGFDDLGLNDAVSRAMELMREHRSAYMVTPNPEIVIEAWKNPRLASAIENADLVLPDGIGVVKAAKILGTPLKERVPGIDTASKIFERMAAQGMKAYLLGARPGVAEKAADFLKEKYPGLEICGTHDGYFDDDAPIIAEINAVKPDFLLVCLGYPKQELWMKNNAQRLSVGLMAGLGGSLDVFAGVVERAPERWQRLGLEWLYRCVKEPKRIKRIARLPLFLVKAAAKRIGKMLNGR